MPLKTHFLSAFHFLVVGSFSLFVLVSCKVEKKAVKPFFQDKNAVYPFLTEVHIPQISRIQKEDLLGITVSSLNKESNDILNFSNFNSLSMSSLPGGGGGSQAIGYSVDSSGNIVMAFVGKIRVENLTLEGAQEKIRLALNAFLKEPAVNIRFMNHKFVVLGEVNKAGAYNLLDDRTTLIDALASAGDLTVFAKRDSITIIRIVNEKREIGKVNLENRDIFKSPYFYLRNGDIVYVEPIAEKVVPLPVDNRIRQVQVFTAILGAIVVLASVASQFF